jgi:tetratricopeptide (TPR) repeat protein
LTHAFLGAETILDMDMAHAVFDVGHCPLDGAPIVGDQQVRRDRAQPASKPPDIGDCRWFAADSDPGRQPRRAGEVAIHRQHGMAIACAEGTGERGKPHLLPADREAGEDVQQQWRLPAHALCLARATASGAISTLDQMLADQPGNIRALLDRAQLEIGANQPDKAKADIEAVLKATPGNVQAWYLQAVIQAQAKDLRSADATLEKINAHIGRIPRGYFLQAVIKQQLGQSAQAEEAIRRHIARAPHDLAAYKLLARLEFARPRPDLAAETLPEFFSPVRAMRKPTICWDAPMRRSVAATIR